jgi:hypothetical protein
MQRKQLYESGLIPLEKTLGEMTGLSNEVVLHCLGEIDKNVPIIMRILTKT